MTDHGDRHLQLVEAARPLIRQALNNWHQQGRRVDRAVVFVAVTGDTATVMALTLLDALYILDWDGG